MSFLPNVWIWFGIFACVIQAGLFSGLNLAVFSLNLLRLQIEADAGNVDAAARRLGLGRSTLYKKLAALGLSS